MCARHLARHAAPAMRTVGPTCLLERATSTPGPSPTSSTCSPRRAPSSSSAERLRASFPARARDGRALRASFGTSENERCVVPRAAKGPHPVGDRMTAGGIEQGRGGETRRACVEDGNSGGPRRLPTPHFLTSAGRLGMGGNLTDPVSLGHEYCARQGKTPAPQKSRGAQLDGQKDMSIDVSRDTSQMQRKLVSRGVSR